MKQRFEHKIIRVVENTEESPDNPWRSYGQRDAVEGANKQLEEFAKEGWELVSCSGTNVAIIFAIKRPIRSKP